MAFALTLQATSINSEGIITTIDDVSVWADNADPRNEHALFIVGEYKTSATPSAVSFGTALPEAVTEWLADTPNNGRYSYTAYSFFLKGGTHAPADQDVQYDVTAGELQQYTTVGAVWATITLADAITAAKSVHTSAVLEVPHLAQAYIKRNLLNGEYVIQIKADLAKGAQQNKLYYSRVDLDYFTSLISAAEYAWALTAYESFYDIIVNINEIILTGELT